MSLRHRSSGRRQGGGTGSSATGRVTGGGPNSSSRKTHANAGGTATGELQLEHSPDSDSKLPVNKPLSALQQAAERVANLSAAMRVAYAPFNRQLYALLGANTANFLAFFFVLLCAETLDGSATVLQPPSPSFFSGGV